MKYLMTVLLTVLSVCLWSGTFIQDYTFNPDLSPVAYGVADWSEDGYGNHRAVLSVSEPADCVAADIEWRRFDKNPQDKNIIVLSPQGEVKWNALEINNFHGKIVFEAPIAGEYTVHYMPYNSSGDYSIAKTEYFSFAPTMDISGIDVSACPVAKVLRIESRKENRSRTNYEMDYDRDSFYSMYPMLITITDNEFADFNSKYENNDFVIFCEDRTNPIKMLHQIPYKWYKQGEISSFTGEAQPNEIYTFQIGVYAKEKIDNLKVTPSDFGDIKASEIHCINTGGVDFKGVPFTKKVSVAKGDVQPLWFYVRVPRDAKDTYKGKIAISDGKETKEAEITITVKGDVLENGGVSDSWRMSRISWLDSSKGTEDTVVKPFTPIKVAGNKISILNRTIELSDLGIPREVMAKKIKILQKPMTFGLYKDSKKLELKPISKKVIKQNEAVYEAEFVSGNDEVELTVHPVIEFDGICEFNVSLKALKDINLSDIELYAPYNKSVAKYGMGFAYRGGFAPASWDWNWDTKSSGKNMMWLGDYDAGMQIRLELKNHAFLLGGSFSPDLLPQGWYNDGKGGASLSEENTLYSFRAYSGEKNLKAGESCDYDFRISVTPFKEYDENRYNYRIGYNKYLLFHGQKGNSYINYPFVEHEYLKGIVDSYKNVPDINNFNLYYSPKDANSKEGSLTLWVRSNKDWTKHPSQSEFINLWMDHQIFQMYWPNDSQSFRTTSFNWTGDSFGTAVHNFVGDLFIPERYMKVGDEHVITFAWTENKRLVYMDGQPLFEYEGVTLKNQGPIDLVDLSSIMFDYKAVRFDNNINLDTEIKAGDKTVILDTFTETYENGDSKPQIGDRGSFEGTVVKEGDYICPKDLGVKDIDVSLYYTSRELSNKCQEIWALRSLGDEIYDSKGFLYTSEGAKELTEDGGGYQWLNEQLQSGYIPGWHMKFADGEHCAAICTKFESRWLNFYVEGIDYLMKNLGMKGIYLDGIGYSRNTMKRVARVMSKNNPDYDINYHQGNDYDYLDHRASPLSTNMEHMPYITSMWMGEMFDYNRAPEYWFTEIAGTPFQLPSELLENSNSNCNIWRGMLYGMAGRSMMSNGPVLNFWDKWQIEKSEVIGYWDHKPAVKVINGDDKVFATVYKQKGKCLIAVASWDNDNDITVSLKVDFKALGLNPKVKITAPKISYFQDYMELDTFENITIPAGKGFVFDVRN
ncbi:MAG: hypothetical protein KBT47_09710 [Armatimonadetes bacterium]|nr:hypothetical protein [Candidatus Hippobium faecium]